MRLPALTANGTLAIVNYFTESCYVCRTLHPKMKRIATDNPDVLFVKVNGSQPAIVPVFEQMGIQAVPLFQFVQDGEVKHSMSCSISPEKLMQLRVEIAAHKRSATHPTVPPPRAAGVVVHGHY